MASSVAKASPVSNPGSANQTGSASKLIKDHYIDIKVVEARNLPGLLQSCFCTVRLNRNEAGRTPHISAGRRISLGRMKDAAPSKGNSNPYWGTDFHFELFPEFHDISVVVWDARRKADIPTGQVSIPKAVLQARTGHVPVEQWYKLKPATDEDRLLGDIHLQIVFVPAASSGGDQATADDASAGVLRVKVLEARDLFYGGRGNSGTMKRKITDINPVVSVALISPVPGASPVEHRTHQFKANDAPTFDELFEIPVRNADLLSSLHVTVLTTPSGKSNHGTIGPGGTVSSLSAVISRGEAAMGRIVLPLASLERGTVYDHWYALYPAIDAGNGSTPPHTPGLSPSPATSPLAPSYPTPGETSSGSGPTRSNGSPAPPGLDEGPMIRLRLSYIEEGVLPVSEYSEFVDFFLNNRRQLVLALDGVTRDRSETGQRILDLIGTRRLTRSFLKEMMEVQFRSAIGTTSSIVQNASLATKVIELHIRNIALPYVRAVLKEPLDEMILEDKYCEVNPFFVDKTTNVKKNLQLLAEYATRVMNAIMSSGKQFPTPLRQVCADLRHCAAKCFPSDPNVRYSAVSAFIFTRLLCPAMMGPKAFHMCADFPNERVARTLTLVAKTVQMLGSLTEYTDKERYLLPLNRVIEDNTSSLKAFLDMVAVEPRSPSATTTEEFSVSPSSGSASLSAATGYSLSVGASLGVSTPVLSADQEVAKAAAALFRHLWSLREAIEEMNDRRQDDPAFDTSRQLLQILDKLYATHVANHAMVRPLAIAGNIDLRHVQLPSALLDAAKEHSVTVAKARKRTISNNTSEIHPLVFGGAQSNGSSATNHESDASDVERTSADLLEHLTSTIAQRIAALLAAANAGNKAQFVNIASDAEVGVLALLAALTPRPGTKETSTSSTQLAAFNAARGTLLQHVQALLDQARTASAEAKDAPSDEAALKLMMAHAQNVLSSTRETVLTLIAVPKSRSPSRARASAANAAMPVSVAIAASASRPHGSVANSSSRSPAPVAELFDGASSASSPVGAASAPTETSTSYARQLDDICQEVEPPTGEVTLVFTDIQNSTAIWESDASAMRTAIKVHNNIMRRCLRRHKGYEVKTEGDAFMVAFQDPVDAAAWCMAAQLELMDAEWPQVTLSFAGCGEQRTANGQLVYRGLRVRMGIHTGDVGFELDDITDRMDYYGPNVRRANRVSSLASGGQIVVSGAAWAQLQPKLRTETLAPFHAAGKPLGEFKLKDLEIQETLVQLLPGTLSERAFPPPGTAAASPSATPGAGVHSGVDALQVRESAGHGAPRRNSKYYEMLQKISPEVSPPTGTVTIVFTHVAHVTELWEANHTAMYNATKIHNDLVRTSLRFQHGYEVRTEGASFLGVFQNVVDAVQWCAILQMKLVAATWPSDILDMEHCKQVRSSSGRLLFSGLRVGIGMHTGEVGCELDNVTERMEYFGPAVSRATLLGNMADGGQIIASEGTIKALQACGSDITEQLEVRFTFAGEVVFKGLGSERLTEICPNLLSGRQFVLQPGTSTLVAERSSSGNFDDVLRAIKNFDAKSSRTPRHSSSSATALKPASSSLSVTFGTGYATLSSSIPSLAAGNSGAMSFVCHDCNGAIGTGTEWISAIGRVYHKEHFVCHQCKQPFGSGRFLDKEGRLYCEHDYEALFGRVCAGCHVAIASGENAINALGRSWHADHFRCTHCSEKLESKFVVLDNLPYHKHCAESGPANACSGCGKPIDGTYTNADGQKWHNECLKCRHCSTPATATDMFIQNGKPICGKCQAKP
ncbi:hypothetical protein CAOG_03826 [Capsaspora owczarzaki ATCC 30864]|uniref:Uncharacterized protein n=1 Tax=Capsaspora owczarzaki (strain ATCC 30864) TaxID=595528 RepID=A0A0D2X2Q2_CAPO3|nr:hypothetical protein CAOG_03826 [Capsaspora owczarzaki ATCC 30864]KJE92954.1 hypothetical protein CAOG_003826 [Capsaspora owczarzaki ATCC 30864]|eukprot:XP_004363554.2 hypothetical protein CAOG_03826 [Capsaspora owczarzaki ATCC 30864]